MAKRLPLLAAAAAVAATPAAATEVEVSGSAQAEIANYRDTGASGDNGLAFTDAMRGELGVDVVEDLGQQVAVLARYRLRLNTTRAAWSEEQREAFVGLEAPFGRITAGSLKPAYKYTGGVTYDPFAWTTLEARSNAGMLGYERPLFVSTPSFGQHGYMSDALGYEVTGENIAFHINASLDQGNYRTRDEEDATSDRGEEGDYSAALKFFGRDWEGFLAVSMNDWDAVAVKEDEDNPGAAEFVHLLDDDGGYETIGRSFQAAKIGGQYEGEAHTFSLQFEGFEGEEEAADVVDAENIDVGLGDQTGWSGFAGYQFDFEPNTYVFQLGGQRISNDADHIDDVNGIYAATGFIHSFSEESRLFLGYRFNRFTSDTDEFDFKQRTWSLGLRKDF
ncbi:Outer membrane protein (porin) [Thiohalospira halophila DSM 15071]|uniref:Outer membrane protein (Porin) n=1 Tax=Thiohalospira halophila DSM 15071 TaxID=1123397 RepID=A0A1I1T4K5_9GAMM|nr:porin [Thiohalospira halophila]SFD53587.1 Outer membrane protein (porin) [Thiohalospira halophila DSM 15071]